MKHRSRVDAPNSVPLGPQHSPTHVRLAIVDDHRVVIEGVRALLVDRSAVDIVGDAESGERALAMMSATAPNIVLLDLKLPDLTAAQVIERSRRAGVRTNFVVFTAYVDRLTTQLVTQIGARGCLLKDADADLLMSTFERVLHGDVVVDPRIADSDDQAGVGLTDRERQVLQRCALGETNADIAEALHLAPNTVKSYLQSSMRKLGARNRVHAIALARAQQLL